MEEMLSPRLNGLQCHADNTQDAGHAPAPRAERSVLDWLRGSQSTTKRKKTAEDVSSAAVIGNIIKDAHDRGQAERVAQGGETCPPLVQGHVERNASRLRRDGDLKQKSPATKSFVANPKHVQLGGRLLSRMLASLLKHKALEDALEFGPNIKLGGEANFLFRSKLRFARKMLRAWLWVQSLERLSALPTPKKTAKGPRVRPQTKPEAGPFAPQGLSVLRRDLPQQVDLSRRLRAQGFRPRVGIWRQKSSVCSCANPSLRPLCGAHCACAVLVGKDNRDRMCSGQPQTDLRMEHPTTTEGKRETRRPLGRLARVSASPSRLRQNKLTHSNAPRAGQIYVDLRYMQALVTTPEKSVARLARRMRAKKTIFSFKDKRPLAEPKPPSQNWRTRLTLPPSQEEWWRGFVVEHPLQYAPP